MIKVRGISFTSTEIENLRRSGFDKADVYNKVNRETQVQVGPAANPKHEMSRYEPVVASLMRAHRAGKSVFQRISGERQKAGSLRRTFMLTVEKHSMKDKFIIYIKGGITPEECSLAYRLSAELGVEIIIARDSVITPEEFMKRLIE